MNAGDTIIASVVVICSTTIIRRVKEGKWQGQVIKVIVFGFLLAMALLTLAIAMPGVASVLAMLGIVGAFVVNGPAVFSLIGNLGR
jgi:hypothetical protein